MCPKVVGQRCVACCVALHGVITENMGDLMSVCPKVAGQCIVLHDIVIQDLGDLMSVCPKVAGQSWLSFMTS